MVALGGRALVDEARPCADPAAPTLSADPASSAPTSERVAVRSPIPVRDPDRYEVFGEHGRGGLGRVSRAHDKDLGRDVAIKEVRQRLLSMAFSSDDRWLAIKSDDEVSVFDTRTSKLLLVIPVIEVRSIAFDPTGPRLVSVTRHGNATIWSIPSGTPTQRLVEAGEELGRVAFSPDGTPCVRVVAAST
jgi:WD40 repeat protein